MLQNRDSARASAAIAAVVFAIAASLQIGCSPPVGADTSPGDAGPRLKTVHVSEIETADIVDRRRYTGGLEASAEVELYPLLSERIVDFPVEEGEQVAAGQTVARIRAVGLRYGQAQMLAEIESLNETIANQKRELERAKRLHETNVVTEQSLQQIESSYRSALAKRKSLEASLGQISVNAGHAVIEAPFDGVVTAKRFEVGDIASPQAPLCKVVETDPIRLDLEVIERDLGDVREGQQVRVEVDAHTDRVFFGEVTRIMPVLDAATRTNEVRVEIQNPIEKTSGRRPLKPGMFARAEIVVGERPGAPVVPARALMVDTRSEAGGGGREVLVAGEGDVVSRRTVEVGVRNDDSYEILAGLRVEERVVVRGQYGVEDGERVRAVEARGNPEPAGDVGDAR
ncbi:MAG: efflux RND transporter periplasmic adaptor subunit [Polyangia bacterium]